MQAQFFRFLPKQWTDLPCMNVELYGFDGKLFFKQNLILKLPFFPLEWFSKRTGKSFQNGACSKNVDKKLGRERRRVVLKSDLAVVATRILTSAF